MLQGPILLLGGLLAAFAAIVTSPGFGTLREEAMDAVLSLRQSTPPPLPVVVVDIDRETLARVGPWPWSRETLSQLIASILAAGPKVLALDILLDGPDERSAAALARRLAVFTGREDLATLAASLPDGDAAMAASLGGGTVIVGLALDPDGPGNDPPFAPILVGGSPDLDRIWQAAGAIGPGPRIANAASGLGIVALASDPDGRIRHVPFVVAAGQALRPGLALEAVRAARDAGAYVVDGEAGVLRVGAQTFVLPQDGMLRLRPATEERHQARTISAARILQSAEARAVITGAVVLLGSSAPEVGGLRPASSGKLVATVQLHADAIDQMFAGDQPFRPQWLWAAELVLLGLMALLAAWAAWRLPPLTAALVTAAIGLGWIAVVVVALDASQWLVDPLTPPVGAVAAFALSAFTVASRTRVREAAIRRRFEQQLPAAVVRRLLETPDLLKLAGEARRVTALFTDIEGFTSMTERAGPQLLVQMLDRYFDGLVRITLEHGGMVDKIVGDGFHAIFNAPLDLDDHASRAIACALAIQEFVERFRAEGEPARLGFGATRIGIETGDVIVGDVGGGRFLDYTAHGDVMNTAARLEAANKDLRSRICIGPVAASEVDASLIRPLGRIVVRGRSEQLAVYEPWPPAMSAGDRAAFRAAVDLMATDVAVAAVRLADLGRRYPDDASLRRLTDDVTRRSQSQP